MQYEEAQTFLPLLDSVLAESQERAFKNGNFRQTTDWYHFRNIGKYVLGLDNSGTPSPDSGLPPAVQAVIDKAKGPDGSIPTKPDGTLDLPPEAIAAAIAALKAECERIGGLTSEELQFLNRLDQQQQDIKAWMDNEDARRRALEERQNKAEAYQLAIGGAQSVVYLLSTFVGFGDPKIGNQISAVGNAFIQVFDSFKKYNDAAANLGKLAESLEVGESLLQAASGAVLAGNILGAVMSIVSCFAEEQKPDNMILEQIGVLQGQVKALHQDMHDRFDRLEAGLGKMYGDILSQFNRIDVSLGIITDGVADIQRTLAGIESKLANFERNMVELVQGTSIPELKDAIHDGLWYEERTGIMMPYVGPNGAPDTGTWVWFENKFYNWATYHAKNLPWQVGGSAEDVDLLDQLSRPLEDNVTYIMNLPEFRESLGFGKPDPSRFTESEPSQYVNPTIWALSSRAHAQLRREWPQHAKRYDPNSSEGVKAAGRALQEDLRRITVKPDTTDGPVPNYELFDKLIAKYTEKYLGLHAALEAVEKNYLAQYKEDINRPLDVNFWGSPWQTVAYHPDFTSTSNPPGTTWPGTITSYIPSPYLLAQ
jgi:hypothetical protein